MKNIISIFALIILASISHAQTPILWQKCYGGGDDDNFPKLSATSDNGLIIAGNTWSSLPGYHYWGDILVIKTDNTGSINWMKVLGGNDYEEPYSIKQTSDKGYILCGETSSTDGDVVGNHGGKDIWVVKLDSLGNISWQRCLGGSKDDIGRDVFELADHQYLVVGNVSSNDGDVDTLYGSMCVWKAYLDSTGNIIKKKTLRLSECVAAVLGYDSTLVILERSFYSIAKVNDTDSIMWRQSYSTTYWPQPQSILQARDKGFLLIGDADHTEHGGQDFLVIKTDSSGNQKWEKYYGGSNGDNGYAGCQTSDGGFLIVGTASSSDGQVTVNKGIYDYWIIKVDTLGNLLWQVSFGGSGADMPSYVKEEIDDAGCNKVVVGGSTESGDGDVKGFHGNRDFWVIAFCEDGLGVKNVVQTKQFNIVPNPNTGNFVLQGQFNNAINTTGQITVTNVMGQIVYAAATKITNGNLYHEVRMPENLPGAVYVLQLLMQDQTISGKIILQR